MMNYNRSLNVLTDRTRKILNPIGVWSTIKIRMGRSLHVIIRQICVETELFTSGMHLNPERKACTYLRPINIFKQCKRFALTHCLWLKAQPLSNRICSFKRSRESKPTPSLNFSQRYLEDPELI